MPMASSLKTPSKKALTLSSSRIPTPRRFTPASSAKRLKIKAGNSSQVKVVARIRPLFEEEKDGSEGGRIMAIKKSFSCESPTIEKGRNTEKSLSSAETPLIKNNGRLTSLEKNPNQSLLSAKSTSLIASKGTIHSKFVFDAVFCPEATQRDVYEDSVGEAIRSNVLEGYNTTIIAHGQSGSGKTYTMSGSQESEKNLAENDFNTDDCSVTSNDGIILRAIKDVFATKQHYERSGKIVSMALTYVEINDEETRDLLDDDDKPRPTLPLKLRDTGDETFFLQRIRSIPVESFEEVRSLIELGSMHRQTACTALNNFSNRSHSICTLSISVTPGDKPQTTAIDSMGDQITQPISAKLTLVDLAGSERIKDSLKDKAITKARINVNKDLFVMAKVVAALAEKSATGKHVHVPYRDSMITRILRESLGGNCFTVMLACVSPSDICFEESMNTLRYAERTRMITNSYQQNVENPVMSPAEYGAMRGENRLLKSQLSQMKRRIRTLQHDKKSSFNGARREGLYPEVTSRPSFDSLCSVGSHDTAESDISLSSILSGPRSIAGEKLDLDIEKKKVTLDRLTRKVSEVEEILRTKGSLMDNSADSSADQIIIPENYTLEKQKREIGDELLELEAKRESLRHETARMEARLQQASRQAHQEQKLVASGREIEMAELSQKSMAADIQGELERLRNEFNKTQADAKKIELKGESACQRIAELENNQRLLKKENDDLRLELSQKSQLVEDLKEEREILVTRKNALAHERDEARNEASLLKEKNKNLQESVTKHEDLLREFRTENDELKRLMEQAGLSFKPPIDIVDAVSIESNLTAGTLERNMGKMQREDDVSIATYDDKPSVDRDQTIQVDAAKMLLFVNKEIQKGRFSSNRSVASSAASSCATDFQPKMKDVFTTLNSMPQAGITEGREPLIIGNIEKVSDSPICSCQNSIFSGNAEYIEFYLPKLGMACSCGKYKEERLLDGADPTLLKHILRPWQVDFLIAQNIHRGVELVHAVNQRCHDLSKAMRIWRKQAGLPAVKTKSCHVALQIWYRTCKAVVRAVRKQKAEGTRALRRPTFLDIQQSDSRTVSTTGYSSHLIDMKSELEL